MDYVHVGVLSSEEEVLIGGRVLQSDQSGIKATWLATDHESSVRSYDVAVGTAPGQWRGEGGGERERQRQRQRQRGWPLTMRVLSGLITWLLVPHLVSGGRERGREREREREREYRQVL